MDNNTHIMALVHASGYTIISFTLLQLFSNNPPIEMKIGVFIPMIIIIFVGFVEDIREKNSDNNGDKNDG